MINKKNWMEEVPPWLRRGEKVIDSRDVRHVGVVKRILANCHAVVEWEETKWLSYIPLNMLRRAPLDQR